MKKKVLIIAAAALVLMLALASCSKDPKFDPDYLIGRTSAEIEEEFGRFDCRLDSESDGLYRNCRCGYTLKEKRVGFLGTDPEEIFFIHFDGDGKAYEFSEGYRPAG